MYLLFKKAYVKPDYLLDLERDRGIITENAPAKLLTDIETKFRNLGTQHFNTNSYDELVGDGLKFANDKEFFEFLYDAGDIDLFVSQDAYNKIFVKWIKVLYPSITKEEAWKLYSLTTTNARLIASTNFYWGNDTNTGVDSQKALADAYTFLNESQFKGLFMTVESTVPSGDLSTLSGKLRAFAPIEYMIAGRLNGKLTYDDVLGTKLYSLLSKKVNEEFFYIKHILLTHINKTWVKNLLGITYDVGNDIWSLKSTNDTTAWLMDTNFGSNNWLETHPNVDLSALRQSAFSAAGASDTDDDVSLPAGIIDMVRASVANKKLNAENITAFINSELSNSVSSLSVDDRQKVNVLLVNYFYELKNTSSSDLAKYSIG